MDDNPDQAGIDHDALNRRCRQASLINLLLALPFLLFVLLRLVTMDSYAVAPETGVVTLEANKYLGNLLAMPLVYGLLLVGLLLVIWAVIAARFLDSRRGIWAGGLGTLLVALALFSLAGYNNTAFYPSKFDLQSSLTIYNASSSHYTLTVMSYVALAVPFVLAYIAYFWRLMDARPLTVEQLDEQSHDLY
ncbi:MAG: cytochrome d ubiquinol oxidase subunit II [Desulfuromonadaceae bacterium]|nr:cytochrome d ubiquinol oxidase subunit II [Desulfuromonadaceae bacterium]